MPLLSLTVGELMVAYLFVKTSFGLGFEYWKEARAKGVRVEVEKDLAVIGIIFLSSKCQYYAIAVIKLVGLKLTLQF